MRVLYASHTSTMSGAELTLLDLLRALPNAVEPCVACPDGELRGALDGLGVPCVRIVGTTGSLRLHPVHSTRALAETVRSAAQLRAAAARFDADLVHANSIRASLIAAAMRAVTGPPVLAHLHDVLPAGHIGVGIGHVLAGASRVVLANSAYTAADFKRKSSGRGHVEVIDNPVDLDRFDPDAIDRATARAGLGLPNDVPIVAIVGQITPWKAQSDAIRAVAVARRGHPDLRLVVAGAAKFVDPGTRYDNQAYDQSLRTLASELEIADAVIFPGQVDDVPALMAAVDLVLVPSWEEPFGRVVIEAMAMRTPVLATNVGGPADIITNGIDGLLLAPQNCDVWGEQLRQLLHAPRLMARLGNAGRTTVAARYGLPSFTRSVVNSYELAIAKAALP